MRVFNVFRIQGSRWRSSQHFFSTAGNVKKRVCIVGAGPAGFYAAQHILKKLDDCIVDMVEKLPVPFGLVRFGVAPDHPEVKNVINTFTKTAEHERFNFYGNVSLGTDISLSDLRKSYHAVLLTYGADKDRRLNIPNENDNNVLSARKFVAWYNGLPGAENLNPDLSKETVTIVGQGNVAVDVARMLLSPIDNLKETDTTSYALETLARSQVKRVYLVGRRGPMQAAFTIKELREMLKLPSVQTLWRPKDFKGIAENLMDVPRPRKRLTELMLKSLEEQLLNKNATSINPVKQFLPVFLRAPKQISQQSIEFNHTRLEDNAAVLTDNVEVIETDLILRSIGYKSSCVDNGICFDERNGRVHNVQGRVMKTPAQNDIDKGLYVAGWLATGPSGVILTTMSNAFAVAAAICEDIAKQNIDSSIEKPGISLGKKQIVTWAGWKRIDAAEIEAGASKGKPREKIVDIEKMLNIACN